MGLITKTAISAILLVSVLSLCQAKDRVYFLAIKEIIWDYAPSGMNLLTGNKLDYEKVPRIYSNMYIGKRYKKAVYRRYTDKTFQTEIPHDPNLGYMGPTIRSEVDDRIIIHLFNNAAKNYSVHPHGVFYTKSNEGAKYFDNSTEAGDDSVPPGGHYTYEWEVLPDYGPARDDPNCLTWMYHSHTHSPVDINSGLIGALLVCRKGTYREDETRTDVDHEFVALFFIAHERETWYFWENLEIFMPGQTVDINERYFQKGNKMHAINGYIYSNTPGYQVCQGDTISWQMMGMGSNRDLHPITFQGQTMLHQHHRKDAFIMIPATLATAVMKADNPGVWSIACKLYNHFTEGMIALLEVDPACRKPTSPLPAESLTGALREYFVAAEEVLWDYGPNGVDGFTGERLTAPDSDSATFFARGPDRIGGVYKKAVYRGYTNADFNEPSPRSDDMGILGPVIAAEVGDTIKIVFKNKATQNAFNMEPHGVYFSEASPVLPQMKHTYTWTLPDTVSPGENDPNCIAFLYTSSVEYISDSNAGLAGPILVCKRGTLTSELAKRNKFVLMTVYDENSSWFIKENIKAFTLDPSSVNKKSGDFKKSNNMHAINGRMYGNLADIELCTDEDTVMHLLAVGTKVDIHAFKFDGINIKVNGVSTGAVNLFPHMSQTIIVRPEYVGSGMMYCTLIDHVAYGMTAVYNARECNARSSDEAAAHVNSDELIVVRRYYIAAEEVMWDYCPSMVNIDNESVDIEGNHGYDHAHREPGKTIGAVYKKVLYFEYTDETFTVKKAKAPHLGFLGPVIKGEVGDTIIITFLNKANRDYNMHPWGAVDPDSFELDTEAVKPGQRKEYTWSIPPSAGPTGEQSSCLSFIYLSIVDRPVDATDGLMGPLLVCRTGGMQSGDIDEEFFLQFQVVDENLSHYIDDNIEEFIGVEGFDKESGSFVESNKMKAINGYLSHVDGLVMHKDDHVRWHLIGWGNEKDYHSIHFHAHTYVSITDGIYRGDVFDVFPGFFGTVEMRMIAIGDWLLHCHVFDHMHGGMETTYTVLEDSSSTTDAEEPLLRRFCDARQDGENYMLRCNNMEIATIGDLFPSVKWRLEAIDENDNHVEIFSRKVTTLDLSNNRLTERQARRLLIKFPNLRVLKLNGNPIRKLNKYLIMRNKMLKTLVLRNTPSLKRVTKNFLQGKTGERDFDLLDFSNNPQLQPACLSHLFMNMNRFVACRDA